MSDLGAKQYAENVASTGSGSGGSGEPNDSYEELATGKYDADGNMIYKKTFKQSGRGEVVTIMPFTDKILYDVKGSVRNNSSSLQMTFGCIGSIPGWTATPHVSNGNLNVFLGTQFQPEYNLYITVYYTYIPVATTPKRATKKTETE